MAMAAGPWADSSTPVEVRFGTTGKQRRLTVLFRLILVLPQFVVLGFVGIAAFVLVVLGWFAALFTGRLPASFARFLLGYVRWYTRVGSYAFLMVDDYPPFSLDPDPTYPVDVTVTTGRLNRAAVLFRIILAVPANIVAGVLSYGMFVFSFITWVITLVLGRMPDALFGASAAAIRYQARFYGYFMMLTSFYPGGLLGDTGPAGQRIEPAASGTPEPQPPPMTGPGGFVAGPAPAWGSQSGAWAPCRHLSRHLSRHLFRRPLHRPHRRPRPSRGRCPPLPPVDRRPPLPPVPGRHHRLPGTRAHPSLPTRWRPRPRREGCRSRPTRRRRPQTRERRRHLSRHRRRHRRHRRPLCLLHRRRPRRHHLWARCLRSRWRSPPAASGAGWPGSGPCS